MMTIEQLDSVPIGGKVKTILQETWRRVHERQWVKEEVFATHDLMRQWAGQEAINDPVDYAQPEPQTWQDVVGCENCEYRLALQRIVLMYEPWTSARSLAGHVLTGGTVEGWQES